MSAFLRKYATATASGTHIRIPMVKAGAADFATSSDWTPATGDVKVSINGGSEANITTLPTYSNGLWEFQLSSGESTGKTITVKVVDSATKAVEDNMFIVETFGNASAMYPVDPSDAVRMGLSALPNASAGANGGLPTGDASGRVLLQPTQTGVTIPTVTTVATTTTLTNLPTAPTDWLTAAAFSAGAVTKVQSGLFLAASYTAPDNATIAAISTAIGNLTNLSALANLFGAAVLEIPDSSSTAYPFTLVVRDGEGKLVDLDGNPAVTAVNGAGTDRSANLSAIGHPATGRYTFTYSVASTATRESLTVTAAGTIGAEARLAIAAVSVVDYDSTTLLATINSKATAIQAKTDNLPVDPASSADVTDAADTITSAVTASTSTTATNITASTNTLTTLLNALPSASTIASNVKTSLIGLFRLIVRKDAAAATDNATDLALLNANGGSGAGAFNNTTDSLEAIRDNGGGGGGGGGGLTEEQATKLDTIFAKVSLITAGKLTYIGPVSPDGRIRFTQGDDLLAATSTALLFTKTGYTGPLADGDVVTLALLSSVSIDDPDAEAVAAFTGEASLVDGVLTITVEATAEETVLVDPGEYRFQLRAETAAGKKVTQRLGTGIVDRQLVS